MLPLPQADLRTIVESTASLWEEARGRRFFITGGTGFFGAWLVESFIAANELLGLNAEAFVLTRNIKETVGRLPHVAGSPFIKLHEGDVRTFEFPSGTFDYVVHAAADANASRTPSAAAQAFDVIVNGAEHVVRFAHATGARKLLFTSSGAVYGTYGAEVARVAESYNGAPDPLATSSAYGEGKRAAESVFCIGSANAGFETKIARCFAFIGPALQLNGTLAAGNFLRDALRGEDVMIVGDGAAVRSYMYASDLATWLWTILFRGRPCVAYNVGSDEATRVDELASLIAHIGGTDVKRLNSTAKAPSRASSQYVPDVTRARQELGVTLRTPLALAIQKTFEWYKISNEGF